MEYIYILLKTDSWSKLAKPRLLAHVPKIVRQVRSKKIEERCMPCPEVLN